jgi:hypothetical protein
MKFYFYDLYIAYDYNIYCSLFYDALTVIDYIGSMTG